MAREIPTFHDAMLLLERFAARRGAGVSFEDRRAAAIDAYQEVVDRFQWAFNKKRYRVNIEAPQSTGTIEYTASSRQMTLTGATWPSDAEDWTVVVSNVAYDIETRSSDTVVVLDSVQASTSDIASGTSYEAFKRYYVLPDDYVAMADPIPEHASTILGTYAPMEEVLGRMRASPESGTSRIWTVGPVPDVYGRMAIFMSPPNSSAETVDIWYRSQPRPLRYSGLESKCHAGTVTLTADSASVSGSSTSFEDAMEGSIFRVGADSTYQPTGLAGVRPWVEQRSVLTYTSSTAITLDAVIGTSRNGVKYTITDPLDLDVAAVPAFYRLAERNLSYGIGGKELDKDIRRADMAIMSARGASNRTNRRRIAGAEVLVPRRPLVGDYYVDEGGIQ